MKRKRVRKSKERNYRQKRHSREKKRDAKKMRNRVDRKRTEKRIDRWERLVWVDKRWRTRVVE